MQVPHAAHSSAVHLVLTATPACAGTSIVQLGGTLSPSALNSAFKRSLTASRNLREGARRAAMLGGNYGLGGCFSKTQAANRRRRWMVQPKKKVDGALPGALLRPQTAIALGLPCATLHQPRTHSITTTDALLTECPRVHILWQWSYPPVCQLVALVSSEPKLFPHNHLSARGGPSSCANLSPPPPPSCATYTCASMRPPPPTHTHTHTYRVSARA